MAVQYLPGIWFSGNPNADLEKTIKETQADRYCGIDKLYRLNTKQQFIERPKGVFYVNGIHSININVNSAISSLVETFKWFDFKSHKMVLAGGSISSLLIGDIPHDFDIFLYDQTPEEANKNILSFINHMPHLFKRSRLIRSMYCYTIGSILSTGRQHGMDVYLDAQIITRIYNNKAEVIHGCDLGSCSFLWDGDSIYTTYAGQYAISYGLNIIDVQVRRGSYEHRLSKYFNRGFGIVFPDSRVDPIPVKFRFDGQYKMVADTQSGLDIRGGYYFHNLNIILPYEDDHSTIIECNSGRRSDYHEPYNVIKNIKAAATGCTSTTAEFTMVRKKIGEGIYSTKFTEVENPWDDFYPFRNDNLETLFETEIPDYFIFRYIFDSDVVLFKEYSSKSAPERQEMILVKLAQPKFRDAVSKHQYKLPSECTSLGIAPNVGMTLKDWYGHNLKTS